MGVIDKLAAGGATDEQAARLVRKLASGIDMCACGFMESDGRHLPYAQCPNAMLGCDRRTHHAFRQATPADLARHNRGSYGLPENGAR